MYYIAKSVPEHLTVGQFKEQRGLLPIWWQVACRHNRIGCADIEATSSNSTGVWHTDFNGFNCASCCTDVHFKGDFHFSD
jgi:hypothetical protein